MKFARPLPPRFSPPPPALPDGVSRAGRPFKKFAKLPSELEESRGESRPRRGENERDETNARRSKYASGSLDGADYFYDVIARLSRR